MLPEVISLAESYNVSRVNTYFVYPNSVCLLVLLINRGPEKVGGDFKGFG